MSRRFSKTPGSDLRARLAALFRSGPASRRKAVGVRTAIWILLFIGAVFGVIYLTFWHRDVLAPGEQSSPGAADSPTTSPEP